MELLVVIVVVVAVVLVTSADDDACGIRPVFATKEHSADFLAKSSRGSDEGLVYEEETLFVRRRNCPVRVRGREIEENETKAGNYPQTLRNGNNSKDNNAKKQNNGHRKLKGSKRKRKKEKRKRFRKKKKNAQGTKTKR